MIITSRDFKNKEKMSHYLATDLMCFKNDREILDKTFGMNWDAIEENYSYIIRSICEYGIDKKIFEEQIKDLPKILQCKLLNKYEECIKDIPKIDKSAYFLSTNCLNNIKSELESIALIKKDGLKKVDLIKQMAKEGKKAKEIAVALEKEIEQDNSGSLTSLNGLKREPISWLWDNRIPKKNLTLFYGQGGMGKSQTTISLISSISNGGNLPDGFKSTEGTCVLISAEDDLKSVLLPRLDATGANLNNVKYLQCLKSIDKNGEQLEKAFTISATDVIQLRKDLLNIKGLQLVVIDPVAAYLITESTKNGTDIRANLLSLQRLAEELNIAIVLVAHENKNTKGTSVADRLSGSHQWYAVARSVFNITRNPDGEGFIFMHIKSNMSKLQETLTYKIEEVQFEDGIKTSKIIWTGSNYLIASDLEKMETEDKTEKCKELFIEAVKSPILSKTFEEILIKKGYKFGTICKAKAELKEEEIIVSRKDGFGIAPWYLVPFSMKDNWKNILKPAQYEPQLNEEKNKSEDGNWNF